MPAASEKILLLRQLLVDRFGEGRWAQEAVFATGLSALDEIAVPRGAVTEIVSPAVAGPGVTLFLYGLLHAVILKGERVILVDGKRAFDPKGLPQSELNRLLWMRCRDAWEAMKAADLVVRDGNIPLVILLLTLNPPGELRRIPATAWHRLQMLAEKSAVTLLVLTPQAQIGCARLRLLVGGAFPLEKLHLCRRELLADLEIQVARRRTGSGRKNEDEELRRAACA
jgi:hypothetical protein